VKKEEEEKEIMAFSFLGAGGGMVRRIATLMFIRRRCCAWAALQTWACAAGFIADSANNMAKIVA